MKLVYSLMITCFLLALVSIDSFPNSTAESSEKPTIYDYSLVWVEDFNSPELDPSVWGIMERRNDGSRRYISRNPNCYEFRDGCLILKGIKNPNRKLDSVPYLTGGIYTRFRKAFAPGKIEVCAKLNCGKGSWPAIWLMPFKVENGWPEDGEIDIMEHANCDKFVYQTLHSKYTKTVDGSYPQHFAKTSVDINKFNIYGVEITENYVSFFINGIKTLTYPKIKDLTSKGEFPFFRDWYLMLNMQFLENENIKIEDKDLPVEMEVDWVKYYQLEPKNNIDRSPRTKQ
ncbi:glycoside hydrolase family 16 protein [uncultured Duncaniella sp.]|uniref:glycoside hydrolase family 16 protein n=1 Tax=uncultured Duncaniella sp. TaxID=2768039 RepID=UPI0025CE8C2F|nr:glycoside hydrolase family 16 protein [uncultured Duncaniella sp.]